MNYTLIGEEVEKEEATLDDITMQLADIICARSDAGKEYGVFLVPEGLIEFIPEIKVLISEINEILSEKFKGDLNRLEPCSIDFLIQFLANFYWIVILMEMFRCQKLKLKDY